MMTVDLPIIAHHQSVLNQKFGTPRQPNLVALPSQIIMHAPYDTLDAFVGLEAYSHLWVIWHFHHNKPQAHFRPQVRPPRLGGNNKLGVFATRSMYRPAAIGLSVVVLERVEIGENGRNVVLHIVGADMIDGTPIIDIKPYLPYSDQISATSPTPLPTTKAVMLSKSAEEDLSALINLGQLSASDLTLIQALIAQDPRVAYRQHDIGIISMMRYGTVDVHFFMNEQNTLIIARLVAV